MEEQGYLDLLKNVLERGEEKLDRTGTGTLSMFGAQLRFDLKGSFPLLTTKRVYWKGVVEELLWFLRGDTNAKHLNEKNVKIWDGNTSRAYLDSIGHSHRQEGDGGAIYGHQWTHWNAPYTDCFADYSGRGIHQIHKVIEQLRSSPDSRRHVVVAWNPEQIHEMALPPCHIVFQFYVSQGKFLSCHMFQRSCDLFLGLPFNISSYALLTYIIAHQVGLMPGELILSISDAHIYKNHIDQVKTLLERNPMPFPTCSIQGDVTVDTISPENIMLRNYVCHPPIKAQMAI